MKKPLYAFIMGSALLVGCNTGDDNANQTNDTPVEDLGDNIQEGARDVENGVNDVLDGNNNNDGLMDNNGNGNVNDNNGNLTGPEVNNGGLEGTTNNGMNGGADGVQNSNGAGQNGDSGVINNTDERITDDEK